MEAKLTTIRSEIEKHLSRSGHNLASFAKVSGLNRGSLSAILHGNPPKPMSLGQLDAVTRAFGFPEGWLYPLYVDECFSEERISRRRIEPFLIRCAEIGKQHCIEDALNRIMEYPKPLGILYSVAEKLFANGKIQESLVFYKIIVDNEMDSYSERMAICQYRIFKSLESLVDKEEQLRAVITFEPYRGRLPENMQLDGLLKLANVCFTLQKWKDMGKYADELRALANAIYRQERRRKNNIRKEELDLSRPLVLYYAQGYLLKATALTKLERYEEAKKYTAGYADLNWFEILDEEGREVVQEYSLFAVANVFTLEILMGNKAALPAYSAFLANNPGEILPGLVVIVEYANRYGFCVDKVLAQFSREMVRFEQFMDPINIDRLYRLRYQISMYLLDRGQYNQGVETILQSLQLAIRLNGAGNIIDCVTLFETYRHFATEQQQKKYGETLKELRKNEENPVNGIQRSGII
ncbi:DNA-binding protein [Paenibacillus riograndensis]|nr:DNA-binding protein [Paenibacillus riograndensis]